MRIDLNVDVAEGFPFDLELLSLASSANLCCGEHAGDKELSRRTAEACREHGVRIGAHPGIPDRESMGRGPWPPLTLELTASLKRQSEFLAGLGAKYLKPHGTLYNASAVQDDAAGVLLDLVGFAQLPLMGLPNTLHPQVAREAGVPFISEGFADRVTDENGLLLSRSAPGAVIHDPEIAAQKALALTGRVDSICVHGDTSGCVELLRAVRHELDAAGHQVGP